MMVFTTEDKVLRQDKRYSSRKLLKEFPWRQCSRQALDQLLHKIDSMGLLMNSDLSSVRTSSTKQCDSGVFHCYVCGSAVLM